MPRETISAKVRFIYVEQMSLSYLMHTWKNKTKLVKGNCIPLCRAGPIVRVHKENFHLKIKWDPTWAGWLTSQMNTYFYKSS